MLSDQEIILKNDLILIMKTLQSMKRLIAKSPMVDIIAVGYHCQWCHCYVSGLSDDHHNVHRKDCEWVKLTELCKSIDENIQEKQDG